MQLKNAVSSADHAQGLESAATTLVEYGDYQCPSCRNAYPIVKRLQKQCGDSLRFVFRNFPLTQAHPMAQSTAEAAEFAGQKGKFWEFHDHVFEQQFALSPQVLTVVAEVCGLDATALHEALSKHLFQEKVKHDFMGGVRSGVGGTPTFFINGEKYEGPADFDNLLAAIESSK